MLREAHDVGFTVAGATNASLLADLHNAINEAIAQGTTLAEFRQKFDETVARNGWNYKGDRNWRTETIFDTNLQAAYAAGRWEQFQRVAATREYLQYQAIRDNRTRPEHAMLSGEIRPIDSDFWAFYYPPNGYRCRCYVISLSSSQMDRYGLAESPADGYWHLEEKTTGQIVEVKKGATYEWQNPNTGKTETIPFGITPGFNYAPGKYAENLRQEMRGKAAGMPQLIKDEFEEDLSDGF